MGGRVVGTRLPGFCLNRIRPQARVRSPPPVQAKNEGDSSTKKDENRTVVMDSCGGGGGQKPESATEAPAKSVGGRRIVIVVDASAEARGAIQWALTHTAQPQDTLVLLHVIKPFSQTQGGCEECSKETAPKAYQLVETMRNLCQLKRPEVKTELVVVRGKDKGPVIVEEAAKQGAGLLVLGQKKRFMSMTWRLLMMWAGTSGCGGVVEYCIQHANCMAVAVRRKSKKLGGYLITTKRQKDFWLLA